MIRASAVIAWLLASGTATAETRIDLPRTKATLVVPDGWKRADEVPGVVVGYAGPGGLLLAVTRAQVPNPDAWRTKKREAYVEAIERGVASSIPGYKRVGKRFDRVNGVPTLDLEARRSDGATIVLRVLLFRTYALSLAVEVPRGGTVREARKIAARFAPRVRHTSDTSP